MAGNKKTMTLPIQRFHILISTCIVWNIHYNKVLIPAFYVVTLGLLLQGWPIKGHMISASNTN